MKKNLTKIAICVCSATAYPLPIIAQSAPEIEKEAQSVEAPKAKTPVEKQVFKIIDMTKSMMDIIVGIKDDTSLEAASPKLREIGKKIKNEAITLLKMDVPDKDSVNKIKAYRQAVDIEVEKKMKPFLVSLEKLPPAFFSKYRATMEEINKKMKLDQEGGKRLELFGLRPH